MRITPISMAYNRQNLRPQNQNLKQNVSFGNFENDEIREEAKSTWLNPETDDFNCTRDAFEYLDATPFVTIKKRKGIVYAVMNKDVTDKHEFKERFDKVFKNYHDVAIEVDDAAIEAGLTKSEPYFLTTIKDENMSPGRPNKLARNLHQDLWAAEVNYKHESSPKEPEYEKSNWDIILERGLY